MHIASWKQSTLEGQPIRNSLWSHGDKTDNNEEFMAFLYADTRRNNNKSDLMTEDVAFCDFFFF